MPPIPTNTLLPKNMNTQANKKVNTILNGDAKSRLKVSPSISNSGS